MLYIRIIDGKYPNFKAIIPKNNNIRYELSKDALKEAIMRLSIVKGASELIKQQNNLKGVRSGITTRDFGRAAPTIDQINQRNRDFWNKGK